MSSIDSHEDKIHQEIMMETEVMVIQYNYIQQNNH